MQVLNLWVDTSDLEPEIVLERQLHGIDSREAADIGDRRLGEGDLRCAGDDGCECTCEKERVTHEDLC